MNPLLREYLNLESVMLTLDGLDEALAGMSAGEEKTFDSELVGGDLIGEPVQVKVAVTAVSEQ